MHNGHPRNPVNSIVDCPHCGLRNYGHYFDKGISSKLWTKKCEDLTHRGKNGFEKAILNHNQFEPAAVSMRLANVVAKEGPLQHMLKVIHKHKNGIDRKELEQIITSCGYAQKLINQAIYLGLIVQSEGVDPNSISFCYLTEKGIKVLNTCKNV